MSDKKELKQEELEEVSGGACGDPQDRYITGNHGPVIDKKEMKNYVGKNVYAVNRGHNEYTLWGNVTEYQSYVFKILVQEGGKSGTFHHNGEESYFSYDKYDFYEKY